MAEEEKEETTTEEQTTDVEEPEVSLDEILSGEDAAEEPEPEVAAEEAPEAESEPEGDKPVDGEDLSDEQVAALPKNDQGFYKGMKEERGKRQTAVGERDTARNELATSQLENQQMREIIKGFQNPAPATVEQKQEATDPITIYDDAEKWGDQRYGGDIQSLKSQLIEMRLETSQNLARAKHEDYDTVTQGLLDEALATPQIADALGKSKNFGEDLYRWGQRKAVDAQLAEAGSLEALVEKRAAELNAAAQDTVEEQQADELVTAAELPKPMSNRRSTGGAAKPLSGYEGDQSLSEVLGGR